ncbi:MAG: hypothetical protein GY788_22390 [bacterium]|nr:hypothetical protein [bacterium]
MSKRANGDGSVYRVKNGGWVATVTIIDPVTGERKRRYRRARTRAAAMDPLSVRVG